jgi:hypothetical protein
MQQSVGALMIIADPFFNSRRDQLVAYSARHKIPTMYEFREFARQVLAKEGITVAGRYGPRTHPAVGIERDARAAFAKLVKQLDLDPPPESRIGGHGVMSVPWEA